MHPARNAAAPLAGGAERKDEHAKGSTPGGLEAVLAALDNKRQAGREWLATCPAHEDRNPSLSIREGADGRVLVICRAGCEQAAVLAALESRGVPPAALAPHTPARLRTASPRAAAQRPSPTAPSREPGKLRHPQLGEPSRAYFLRDVSGALAAVHARFDLPSGKTFRWWRSGEWHLDGLNSGDLPLYRSEHLPGRPGELVIVTEGEKAADALAGLGVLALGTATGASGTPRERVVAALRGRRVLVWADADEPGRAHAHRVAESARSTGALEVRLYAPAGDDGRDAADVIAEQGAEAAGKFVASLWESAGAPLGPIGSGAARVLTFADLLATHTEPRPFLLEPLLRERDLAMLFGWRGIGKTWVALGIGWAVATGGEFLRWSARQPGRVLLVDGEMPVATLRERLAGIAASSPSTCAADAVPLSILAADAQDAPLPSLASAQGQAILEPHLAGVKLLILDNVSTLLDAGDENEAAAWGPAQRYLLELRRRGLAVLLVHHAGKGGDQRGTSRREDVLDLVLAVRRPSDYRAAEGARLELEAVKARGLTGEAVEPFEAALVTGPSGEAVWSLRDVDDARRSRADLMFADGMKAPDVAAELRISRATAYRWAKEHREERP